MMKARTAQQLRKWHRYVGLFFTPAILFFSLSGALQTLGLHESHGAAPPAPTWIAWMASVHKDQRVVPEDHSPHSGGDPDDHEPAKRVPRPAQRGDAGPSPIPLKAFVILLALGLMASSLLGVLVALNNAVTRRSSLIALGLGLVVPILLGAL